MATLTPMQRLAAAIAALAAALALAKSPKPPVTQIPGSGASSITCPWNTGLAIIPRADSANNRLIGGTLYVAPSDTSVIRQDTDSSTAINLAAGKSVDLVAVCVPKRTRVTLVSALPAEDSTQMSLPSGGYAGILCDSLVMVNRRTDGSYYLLHTMGSVTADTQIVRPMVDSSRSQPWVAVAVGPVSPSGRVAIAYLPGDQEVLRHKCIDGPTTSFTFVRSAKGDSIR